MTEWMELLSNKSICVNVNEQNNPHAHASAYELNIVESHNVLDTFYDDDDDVHFYAAAPAPSTVCHSINRCHFLFPSLSSLLQPC